MASKKILLLSILASFASHILMLSLTGLVDFREKTIKDDILTVSLKEPDTYEKKEHGEKNESTPSPRRIFEHRRNHNTIKEDTVDLGSIDQKYSPYLKRVKNKIETIWTYPRPAYEREEEGITVVKFSVTESGNLTESGVVSSSGSPFLDQGALDVVKSAAPYDPFPREFNLSRLNIVARFQYKLVE